MIWQVLTGRLSFKNNIYNRQQVRDTEVAATSQEFDHNVLNLAGVKKPI